jgi:DNA ligase-associated metallophosphoesterase
MPLRVEIDNPEDAGARAFRFKLAGRVLEALPCGGLWDADARLLVISDLHLEKGSAYAASGQMLPPYDTRATLARVALAVARLKPETVISLGDSFHDTRSRPRIASDDVDAIRALTAQADWVWITGNHDPAPAGDLGGRITAEIGVGGLTYRHEPAKGACEGEVAGHLHPGARVAGRAGMVRARCFVSDGRRLVMPAYGALTGSLNVRDPAISSLFPNGFVAGVIGRDRVYAVGISHLAPDGAMRRYG